MDISPQIEAVYQRALRLRQHATESPIQQQALEDALRELYYVLDELQASEDELKAQNQELISAAQRVEAERQRYHDLFNQAPDGYLVTDAKGKIQEANVAIASMLKVLQPFLVGKPLAIFIAEASRLDFYSKLDRLNPKQGIQDWELQLCPREGILFDAAVTLTIVREPGTGQVSLRWLLRDITERKQTARLLQCLNLELEHQVQERTSQLQQALEFEAGLKRITDKVRDSLDESHILQGVVREVSLTLLGTRCCTTASYDFNVMTSTILAYYRSPEAEMINESLPTRGQTALMTGFPEGYRQLLDHQAFQFCSIDPSLSQAAILACPIADDRGVLGDLWLFKPATEMFHQPEIRLVQQVATQCAITIRQARLYRAAQQQVEELERLNRLKDDFLNTVSHELRTPMASIRMAIQMLEIILEQAETLPPKLSTPNTATRYLQILRSEYEREMRLIDDLLDLTRLDSQTESLVLSTLNPGFWIPHIVEPFEAVVHSQQQQLQINIPAQLPDLTTDFSYLEQILTELLNNAYKYTASNETITISAQATPEALQLSVSNSGVTIPAQELTHLFDKFYRVPSHDPWKHSGTGLGLALVKKRVEQLQSTIEVSIDQGWITFTLHIPWTITSIARVDV